MQNVGNWRFVDLQLPVLAKISTEKAYETTYLKLYNTIY